MLKWPRPECRRLWLTVCERFIARETVVSLTLIGCNNSNGVFDELRKGKIILK